MNIVLDIDHTLVYTRDTETFFTSKKIFSTESKENFFERENLYHLTLLDAVSDPGSGTEDKFSGSFRPGMRDFLRYCEKTFNKIIIWTAGRNKYAEAVCEKIFPISERQPDEILTYDDCIINDRVIKPLSFLYEKFSDMNENNTIIIDDTKETFSMNIDNAIHIPRYNGDPEDNYLYILMEWFEKNNIKEQKNFRTMNKNIF